MHCGFELHEVCCTKNVIWEVFCSPRKTPIENLTMGAISVELNIRVYIVQLWHDKNVLKCKGYTGTLILGYATHGTNMSHVIYTEYKSVRATHMSHVVVLIVKVCLPLKRDYQNVWLPDRQTDAGQSDPFKSHCCVPYFFWKTLTLAIYFLS